MATRKEIKSLEKAIRKLRKDKEVLVLGRQPTRNISIELAEMEAKLRNLNIQDMPEEWDNRDEDQTDYVERDQSRKAARRAKVFDQEWV